VRKISIALALVLAACRPGPEPVESAPEVVRYQIVRFHVKSGSEAEFERFFTESLLQAAEKLSESPEALERAIDTFDLLRPVAQASDQPSTYYVFVRGAREDAGGEVMRDMVRDAFPPAEARERIERWMSTIDLESLVPRGEEFEKVILRPSTP
jgi:hypothetical protein